MAKHICRFVLFGALSLYALVLTFDLYNSRSFTTLLTRNTWKYIGDKITSVYAVSTYDENCTRVLSNVNSSVVNQDEIESYINLHCLSKAIPTCNDTIVGGPIKVNRDAIGLDDLYKRELPFVKHGGWWSPDSCLESNSTAVVIPFRDRYQHLPTLLRYLHPLLQRQYLHYRIFVVEQDDENGFNRGKLMNVGYNEALKIFPYSCFVFHDVDLVPEDERIRYGCIDSPMHLSAYIDKFKYHLLHWSSFGGVSMLTANDYASINGFSNIFYAWGGEDENLSDRTRKKENKMTIHRQSSKISRYTMLSHKRNDVNRTQAQKNHIKMLMSISSTNWKRDGVNTLQYKVKGIVEHQLFTIIKVDLQKDKEKNFGIKL